MKIRLNEIPEEGRSYIFDRKSGEINEAVADVVGTHDYKADIFIKPIGGVYEVSGKIETTLDETCSTCGYDFELPVTRAFREILVQEKDEHRKSQSVHGNQSVDFLEEGLAMATVKGQIFDAGDYVHEVIAFAEPFYPTCGVAGGCLHEEEAREILRKLESEFAKAEEKRAGHPAFSVLQDLSLNRNSLDQKN